MSDIRRYLKVFQRRQALFWEVLLAILILTGVSLLLIPPTYRAEVKILVQQRELGASILGGNVLGAIPGLGEFRTTLDTQIEIIRSRPLLEKVIQKEDLREKGRKRALLRAEEFLEYLDLFSLRNTDVISLRVEWYDSQKAASIANSLADLYLQETKVRRKERLSQSREFYEEQVKSYEQKIEQVDLEMEKFKSRSHLLDPTEQIKGIATLLGDLEATLTQAKIDYRSAVSGLKSVETEVKKQAPRVLSEVTTSTNPVYLDLRRSLAQAQIDLAALQTRESMPQTYVKELETKIVEIQKSMSRELEKEVSSETSSVNPVYQATIQNYIFTKISVISAESKIKAVEKERNKLTAVLGKYSGYYKEYADLWRRKNFVEGMLTSLRQGREQLGISQAEEIGSIRIIEPAEPPFKPIRPRKALTMLLAFIFGVVVAGFTVLFAEAWSETQKAQSEASVGRSR